MANWSTPPEYPDRFGFEVAGRSRGTSWLLVFMGMFTGCFALSGLLTLAFAEAGFTTLIGLFLVLIGGIGVYSAVANWHRDYRRSVWFDRHAREVRFRSSATRQQDYRIGFERCERLHIFRPYQSGGRRRAGYGLALLATDGSELVLETSVGRQHIADLATQLVNFTGFPVTTFEQTETAYEQKRKDYAPPADSAEDRAEPSAFASKFVRERATPEGREIRLQTARMTTSAKIINTVVLGVFLGAPVLLLGNAISQASDAGSYVFLFFIGTFSLAFYSVVALVILTQLKDYALIVRRDRLLVRIEVRARFARLLQRTIELPAEKIAGVQINLSEEGHFWLALQVAPDFPLPSVPLFLAGATTYARGVERGRSEGRRIALWEINAQLPSHENSASTADFETVAAILRSDMDL